MNKTKKFIGRIVAGAYYDMQEVRKATKNRIRDVIRKKAEGIDFDEVEEEKEEDDYSQKYTDDQLFEEWKNLKEKGDITEEEFKYVKKCWEVAKESKKIERKYKTQMMDYVKQEPIYIKFLQHVRGIGPVLSANLIKEFGNCSTYDTVSALWKHTGNHVKNGKAPKLKKGEDISYSPKLRTLTWKISDCLMKANKAVYRRIYDSEKKRQLAKEYEKGYLADKYNGYDKEDTQLSKGHAHNRALRKMRKIFLAHYWSASRELDGLETRESYVKEKLGHKNIITWKDALKEEKKRYEK